MVAPAAGQVVLVPFPFSDLSQLDAADFASGGLMVPSFARPGKLFTAHGGLILRSVGMLSPTVLTRIRSAVVAILQSTGSP
jgi:mRNA interferase MazF